MTTQDIIHELKEKADMTFYPLALGIYISELCSETEDTLIPVASAIKEYVPDNWSVYICTTIHKMKAIFLCTDPEYNSIIYESESVLLQKNGKVVL